MNGRAYLLLFLTVSAVLAVGCSQSGSGEAQESRKPAVAVDVAAAASTDLEESIDLVGSLAPKLQADVKSEFTGVVTEVFVTEWAHVAKGQPLARLDTREAEAELEGMRASLLQAEVNETRANRELERAIKLKQVGLLTQQGLDDARSAQEASVATTAAVRAQLRATETRLAKAVMRAPFDGVVAYRGVSVGDRVESMGGGPAFRIVDNRVLDLVATLPTSKLASIKVGQELTFTTDAVPGRTFAGRIAFINPATEDVSRAIRVMAEVKNDDGALTGGLFVEGRILVGKRVGVLQIPRAAVVSWDVERGVAEVFVVNEQTAERREVRTGETTADTVEVAGGLTAGELVVTRGAFNLRPGDRVQFERS